MRTRLFTKGLMICIGSNKVNLLNLHFMDFRSTALCFILKYMNFEFG